MIMVEDKWKRIKRIVLGSMIRKRIRIKDKELGDKDWWDRRCTRRKRELKKVYWRWRKGKIGRNRYVKERKKFRSLLEEVQKEKRIREEEELRSLKREAEVWKFINKKRGVRKWNTNNIGEEDWRSHFMNLLEGEEMTDRRKVKQKEKERDIEEEISLREVRDAIRKLKVKKAAGIDGIPMEAWKFASEDLIKELADLIRTVWVQGTLPCDWRISILVPLHIREGIGRLLVIIEAYPCCVRRTKYSPKY